MEFNEFSNIFKESAEKLQVNLTDQQIFKFYTYMNLLLEWNEKVNLTAITEYKDVILKHFIDSLTVEKYINGNKKIIDIGTGAGFPGIPIKIIKNDVYVTLMDSLNKRINFLNEVIKENKLDNIETVHARAEELARNKKYREQYDIAIARAVASLNVLLEYMLPFVKKGGYCICMKGSNINDEIEKSQKALNTFNAKIEKIDSFNLPESEFGRNIIIIKKIGDMPSKYPRKAGTPSKDPIV